MLDFLILNWGGCPTQTNQLTDCGLMRAKISKSWIVKSKVNLFFFDVRKTKNNENKTPCIN